MDSRDVNSGTRRSLFDGGVDNYDSKTENLCVQQSSAVLESFI